MLDNVIQWLNAFPSRKVAIAAYIAMFLYTFVILQLKIYIQDCKELDKRCKRNKRFVYCDGKKSNVSWVEFVTQTEYDNLLTRDDNGNYHVISYPIIDRNASSTYFKID